MPEVNVAVPNVNAPQAPANINTPPIVPPSVPSPAGLASTNIGISNTLPEIDVAVPNVS